MKNFIAFFGDIPVLSINVKNVEKYKAHLQNEKKYSPNVINIELRHLSAMFSLAVKYGYILKNPFKETTKVKIAKKLPIFLSPIQADEFLDFIEHTTLYPYVLIALNTGARVHEIVKLKWKNIDWDNNTIKLHGKGDKERSAVSLRR